MSREDFGLYREHLTIPVCLGSLSLLVYLFVPSPCMCSTPSPLIFCHHTLQKGIFFCGWMYFLVSRLKELLKVEMVKRVPYLNTTTVNHVWGIGRALNWAELLLGHWGPSEGWNADSRWNWTIRWGFPLLFLPKGSRVSISWPENQGYPLIGQTSQATSVPFEVQLKAVVPGEILIGPVQACTPCGTGLPSTLWLLAFWGPMTDTLTIFYQWDRVHWCIKFLCEFVVLKQIMAGWRSIPF